MMRELAAFRPHGAIADHIDMFDPAGSACVITTLPYKSDVRTTERWYRQMRLRPAEMQALMWHHVRHKVK